ncbi:MAG: 2-amino-4-hydroxy-6-hydroxymethyldihydropteridine diphosphokinase [Acidimicrobiia bacterium]
MTVPAAIGLGSNLGDRVAHLREAVARLGSAGEVVRTSSLYETSPVGGPEQGPFLNAVVILNTGLDPWPLLQLLHQIENEAGRTRHVRWGPRTLDLDLIVYDAQRLHTELLTIPHPRAHERAFVLIPLLEVWPEAHLGRGAVGELAAGLADPEVTLISRDWTAIPGEPVPG